MGSMGGMSDLGSMGGMGGTVGRQLVLFVKLLRFSRSEVRESASADLIDTLYNDATQPPTPLLGYCIAGIQSAF